MTVEFRRISSRQEWLQWRQQDVTASDVAAVCGRDSYRTAAKVWAEKTGVISPSPQTEFLEFRLALEAAVIDMLRMRRPSWRIERAGVYLRDPDLRLGATPDAVAVDPDFPGFGIVQCKTVVRSVYEREWHRIDDEYSEAPLPYQIQTLTESMLAGAAWAIIPALILDGAGTGSFTIAKVPRNERAEEKIRIRVAEFWAATDAGRMPRIDYERDAEVVDALHPKPLHREPPLDLSGDNELPVLLARRADNKRSIADAEKECDAIDTELKHKIGNFDSALTRGWKVTWKMKRREEKIVPAAEWRELRVYKAKEATP